MMNVDNDDECLIMIMMIMLVYDDNDVMMIYDRVVLDQV